MALSRGLRKQLAANERSAEAGELRALLLAALEDPEIRQAVCDVVRRGEAARARRSGITVSSAAAARDLKAARLEGRGRQRG